MRAQRAPEAFRRGIRSTYVKGLDTPRSLPNRAGHVCASFGFSYTAPSSPSRHSPAGQNRRINYNRQKVMPPAGEADPDVKPHPRPHATHVPAQSSTTPGAGHSIPELLQMYRQLPGCTKYQARQPVTPHACTNQQRTTQLKQHLGGVEPLTWQEKTILASHPLRAQVGTVAAPQRAQTHANPAGARLRR